MPGVVLGIFTLFAQYLGQGTGEGYFHFTHEDANAQKSYFFYQKYMSLLTLSILKLPRKADGDRDTTIPGGPSIT